MLWRALRLAVVFGVLVPASAWAGVKATPIGTFNAPTYIAAPPGDTQRLFVVQQAGQIEVLKGGHSTPFLDISSKVTFSGEQGLLSMAFAPDYAASHRFYVYYTDRNCDAMGGCDEHVSEFTAESDDSALAAPEHVLITIPHPNESNHNGGQLQFGPDGDLYISVGDGGGSNDTEQNAQSTKTLLGKLLRISPGTTSYTIPDGNPFNGPLLCSNGTTGANCPEIWDYGLRNPWRFSFDSETGDLIIGDVGQDRNEEIDFAHPGQNVGANYGWPCYEGFVPNTPANPDECSPLPAPVVAPVFELPACLCRPAVLRQRHHRRLRDARSDAAIARRLLRVRRPEHSRSAGRGSRSADGGRSGRAGSADLQPVLVRRRCGGTCTQPTSSVGPSIGSTPTA